MGSHEATGSGQQAGPGGDEAGPSSSSSSNPTSARRFPLAAQPEVMRAAEKDDQYASFVYDACRDAFRHLFGSSILHYTSQLNFQINLATSNFTPFFQVQELLWLTRTRLAHFTILSFG